MTQPRHLWSGDWELESSAHADDLASRRGRNTAADEPDPAEETQPPARPPSDNHPIRRAIKRLQTRLRGLRRPNRRRVRVALLATFLVLLGATAAYAVISNSSNSDSTTTTQTVVSTGGQPWLGVKLANAPVRGALVSAVVPNSPAAQAGIRPGDLITQLDTQPIVAPAVLTSAIDGLQPGNTVDIELQRGASQYTAHVKLATSPSKTP